MRIGIAVEETWSFLNEIYAELSEHHHTTLFKRRTFTLPIFNTRINRYLFHRDMQALMDVNDVVFFEWASELLATASQLKKRSGIVARLHRYEMYKWVDKINWDAVDKIILVSKAKEREFVSRFPDQASKIVVINEAVSLSKFHPEPREFSGDIGILCHLTPRKRVYDLILTFAELTQQREDLHLHIAGGRHIAHGAYYEAMHRTVRELNLQDKVTFYGNMTETSEWYHKIDVFISNSYSEGLQVAPMEAMASGCYCISHRWDGAEELLPSPYLFYTDHELKEKLLDYCEMSEADRQQERHYMRSIVCNSFDIDKTKVLVRELIEEVAMAHE
jgi:glycosyltransferase involved in cell wall biosynthesis